MKNCAYIFPGQGAQHVGMGKEFYDSHPEARDVFDTASKALGFDIAKLCFEGPAEELTATSNSQPAILTASYAALKVFQKIKGKDIIPKAALGLSLGEYTALVAAGSLEFTGAVKLVRLRGQFMEEAAGENPGTMASLIGLSKEDAQTIAGEAGVEVANLNCPGQVVISGKKEAVEAAAKTAREKGAKRAIMLDVSGPFHSSLMNSAAEKLKKALEGFQVLPPRIPVVSNFTANYEGDPEKIKQNLIEQVNHRTLWEDSIRLLIKGGVDTYFEIGPGKALKGLLRRIDPRLAVHNIQINKDLEDLN